jgi:hypothetical protein
MFSNGSTITTSAAEFCALTVANKGKAGVASNNAQISLRLINRINKSSS